MGCEQIAIPAAAQAGAIRAVGSSQADDLLENAAKYPEEQMAHVSVDRDTTLPPQAILGALTDFSPRRLELWPNVDSKHYQGPSGLGHLG